ncbi:RluA family pseudouridine synthase [Candidatus Peregrinibacteria bacterium]|jgi:23S rRNA pseudouridine1911/1915/1917 synthase|nr:RluA family pseudouridine synthase [Candidatus Peregrinibacteria bacterium]MBT4631882.1 RluA family pseudouridine synthase [Candidatus Peregrinibacteria bacterium]MBT5516662.1 RluA family pseudouridine synthase [Candidatus Peregrinibacteria bacterium]MBT5824197.1 RluA family pseudouridine synthase [Candidatus Peregrinibacteria bacterium]
MQFQSIKITEKEVGQRLDIYLSERLDISRSQVQILIKEDNIHLNDKGIKKAGVKLKDNDKISYRLRVAKETKVKAQNIELEVIHEDKNLLVINKAAGMVVHPAASGHMEGTVVNAALAHCKLSSLGDSERPGIVHRLDKETSGVLLIAKSNKTHQKLAKLFQDREIEKTYIALVKGVPKTKKGRIDAALKRSSKARKEIAINPQGRNAITSFEIMQTFRLKNKGSVSMLKVNIETGRTHQIRVHLGSIGHPVIGDKTYGDKKINKYFREHFKLNRQFLHAKTLAFEGQCYEAKLSDDLEGALKILEHPKSHQEG